MCSEGEEGAWGFDRWVFQHASNHQKNQEVGIALRAFYHEKANQEDTFQFLPTQEKSVGRKQKTQPGVTFCRNGGTITKENGTP